MGLQQRLLWMLKEDAGHKEATLLETPEEFERLRWEAITLLLKQLGFTSKRLARLTACSANERPTILRRLMSHLPKGCAHVGHVSLLVEIMLMLNQRYWQEFDCQAMREYIEVLSKRSAKEQP